MPILLKIPIQKWFSAVFSVRWAAPSGTERQLSGNLPKKTFDLTFCGVSPPPSLRHRYNPLICEHWLIPKRKVYSLLYAPCKWYSTFLLSFDKEWTLNDICPLTFDKEKIWFNLHDLWPLIKRWFLIPSTRFVVKCQLNKPALLV